MVLCRLRSAQGTLKDSVATVTRKKAFGLLDGKGSDEQYQFGLEKFEVSRWTEKPSIEHGQFGNWRIPDSLSWNMNYLNSNMPLEHF